MLNVCNVCKKEKEKIMVVESPDLNKSITVCENCFKENKKEVLQFLLKNQNIEMESMFTPSNNEGNDFLVNFSKEVDENYEPVLFRNKELNRAVQVLLRKTKNNPILIGEAGVGKTAIVELLAHEIANNNIPRLQDHTVYSLNIASMMSGTRFRGEFEAKFESLIQNMDSNTILFIDEIHLIMGAGSSSDNNIDFANLLKPYLSKGKIKVIGATTLSEYREIEKDPAIARRFQPIKVAELTADETLVVLEKLKPSYEKHHNVTVTYESLEAIVELANDYMPYRQFPDKAIDVLDEACSLISLKQPRDVEELKKEFYHLLSSMGVKEEIEIISKAVEENEVVNVSTVTKVIENMTNIPVSRLTIEGKKRLLNLDSELRNHLIGQDEAIDSLSRAVKRSRLRIKKVKKPTVLLFAGQTGVGKTELVKSLAKSLFGNEDSIVRFDMSEYMEEHSISKLIGSPPGYVGHEEEGLLTEKIRRNPYSIILLDEFEKSHSKISNLFLQVFDDGRLTDSKGRTIDFKNTIIILTSNIGIQEEKQSVGFGTITNKTSDSDKVGQALKQAYPPEFLNRIDEVITFNKLKQDDISKILDIHIKEYQNSLMSQGIELKLDQEAKSFLIEKGFNPSEGARSLGRVITRELEDVLIDYLLVENDIPKTLIVTEQEGSLSVS